MHTFHGVPTRVNDELKEEILIKFNHLCRLKTKGINLFFTDIEKIKAQMLKELKNKEMIC